MSDEIYCHSQLDGSTTPFTSAVTLEAYREFADRIHVVWGFAKDFGLSGFRTGFVLSKNPAVHRVMLGSKDPAERTHPLPWFTPFDLDPNEEWLFNYLAAKPTEVSLLPGGVMHNPVPGFYRLCFTARPAKDVVDAVGRMAAALRKLT